MARRGPAAKQSGVPPSAAHLLFRALDRSCGHRGSASSDAFATRTAGQFRPRGIGWTPRRIDADRTDTRVAVGTERTCVRSAGNNNRDNNMTITPRRQQQQLTSYVRAPCHTPRAHGSWWRRPVEKR